MKSDGGEIREYKMHKTLAIIAAAATLAGCVEQMEITQAPVEVERSAGFVSANYVGSDQATIRSYFAKDAAQGTERTEFSGAACQLKGRGFSTAFNTPAIVNLPDYDYHSQPVTGQCAANGHVRPVVMRPYNETVRARTSAAANAGAQGGLIGMLAVGIVSGVVEAANDATDDDWDYGDVQVEFPAPAAQPAS